MRGKIEKNVIKYSCVYTDKVTVKKREGSVFQKMSDVHDFLPRVALRLGDSLPEFLPRLLIRVTERESVTQM